MDQILHQLGGLLLGSVPTILLFVVLIILYRVLVYGALTRVLAERRARTEGAMEQAHDAIAAADAKAQEYEAKVRMARVEIFQPGSSVWRAGTASGRARYQRLANPGIAGLRSQSSSRSGQGCGAPGHSKFRGRPRYRSHAGRCPGKHGGCRE